MATWPVYYNKKVGKYYLICLVFLLIPLIIVFSASSNAAFFEKHDTILEKVLTGSLIVLFTTAIIIQIIGSVKHQEILNIINNILHFHTKSINLAASSITFGKFGFPKTAAEGSILYISDGKEIISIAILKYYSPNPNLYTKAWSRKVDCFIDKKDFKNFLSIIEGTQPISGVSKNLFNTNAAVFELRGSFAAPIFISIENGVFTIRNEFRTEIFSTQLNTIITDVYRAAISNSPGSPENRLDAYLTMKLKIPGFRTIKIGMHRYGSNLGNNQRLKWYTSLPPDYIIDAENWEKLAKNFNINV